VDDGARTAKLDALLERTEILDGVHRFAGHWLGGAGSE
jgi:hypothetical protein